MAISCIRMLHWQQPRKYGDPCRIRTCDRRLRRPVLYPAELRGREGDKALQRAASMPDTGAKYKRAQVTPAARARLPSQWVQGWLRLGLKLSE